MKKYLIILICTLVVICGFFCVNRVIRSWREPDKYFNDGTSSRTQFNGEFDKFFGSDIKGNDLKLLLFKVEANNGDKYSEHKIEIVDEYGKKLEQIDIDISASYLVSGWQGEDGFINKIEVKRISSRYEDGK